MTESTTFHPSRASNGIVPDLGPTRRLEMILDEQKQAHAKIVLTLTRDLDGLLRELNGFKYEQNYLRVMVSLLLSRMKKSYVLRRLFSYNAKLKVVRLLAKIGI